MSAARKFPRRRARAGTESGLVRFVDKPLTAIRPSPENEQLYRPVLASDPDIIALADSIRQHGLQEPIVITLDDYILSGHRRHMACRLAGLRVVPCRVVNLRRTDPEFMTRLREANRQRVKTVTEIAREEIAAANPEEAYRALVEHRQQRACVDAQTIQIVGSKHRAEISKAKEPMLQAILAVLEARRKFWPLTERQIHYALLNNPPLIHAKKPQSTYRNTVQCYKALCDLVTRARLDYRIPFRAIEDPTRPVQVWQFHVGVGPFIRAEMDQFLKGYYRDLQQSQPNHIEIVGEKNTIQSIIRPVAEEYCIPMTIGRGYCSIPPRHAMAERFEDSGKEKLILLVLSDFDPEGEDIAHSFARSLRDDFLVDDVEPVKVALTAAQVRDLNLPPIMKAKQSSSRYGEFVERHGDNVFELEAVPPEQLQALLRQAIDSVLDVAAYNAEVDAEKQDAAQLAGIRRRIQENIAALLPNADDAAS
jgi:ParB-like nuclease domain